MSRSAVVSCKAAKSGTYDLTSLDLGQGGYGSRRGGGVTFASGAADGPSLKSLSQPHHHIFATMPGSNLMYR